MRQIRAGAIVIVLLLAAACATPRAAVRCAAAEGRDAPRQSDSTSVAPNKTRIEGCVQWCTGEPASGVTVIATGAYFAGWGTVQTDAAGMFVLDLPVGGDPFIDLSYHIDCDIELSRTPFDPCQPTATRTLEQPDVETHAGMVTRVSASFSRP